MECPKCGKQVSDDAKICPHCNKILKLTCPQCHTVNSNVVCSKCGFTILSKCEKCGITTPTIKGTCSKCGFSTYTSVAMAAANIEQFAVLILEFPNLDEIREVLGSKKLVEKFLSNLDALIVGYCNLAEITREIINDRYVLKFNKSDTFFESALSAMTTAVDLSKDIILMNFKLSKSKAISLECKLAVVKRTVNDMPENFQSGLDIKLVSNYPKEFKYLNYFQIITDLNIYQEIMDDFSLSSLSSSYINGEMVTFFELNLKKHLKVDPPKEEEEAPPMNMAQIEEIKEVLFDEHEEMENKLYNKDVITFDDMKCSFELSTAYDIPDLIYEGVTKKQKTIFMLKSTGNFRPDADTTISKLSEKNLFKSFYRVTCHSYMKYKPYGFFHELLSVINNLSKTPKLFSANKMNDLGMFDKRGIMSSMFNMAECKSSTPEESRFIFYEIITNILKSYKKILIYIDNFELIDESSYEILKMLWQNNLNNITFVISTDIDSSVHKTAHFLLQSPSYAEVRMKPVSIKHIVENEQKKYAEFANTYYFTSLMQGMKGSYIFFINGLEYLREREIIENENDSISVISNKACVLSNDLEHLLIKRLQSLMKDSNTFNTLAAIAYTAPMITLSTAGLLELPNINDILTKLKDFNYISIYSDNIYVNNYETLLNALEQVISPENKNEIINNIANKIYANSCKTSEEISIAKQKNDINAERKILEHLSNVTASLGDLSAYLNCTSSLIKIMEKDTSENAAELLEEHKIKVYENISKMLTKYTPHKIYNISKSILNNLEKSDDLTKLVAFSIKMIKTSMVCGNYSYTIDLVNKVLARMHTYSLNPESQNFNLSFFLITLIRIEALFSIGRLRECEEIGNEIILFLKSPKLKNIQNEHIDNDEFQNVVYSAMTFVVLSKVLLLRKKETIQEFLNELQIAFGNLPKQFEYMLPMKDVMVGKEISVDLDSKNDEKFTKIIKATLRAFAVDKEDNKKFANDIYEAKICANINNYGQLEILFDLLIGYAYFKLGAIDKSMSIYNNVIEISELNGFKLANYIACYLLSMLYYGTGETETALALANNTVSHIEKDNNVGDYLFYLFRILTSGIYTDIGDEDAATACIQSAVFVKKKDEVVFGLENVDMEVVERRVNDRRKVRQDVGGRRKGQRRITDDMKLLENLPQEENKKSQEDMRMLKDFKEEKQKDKNIFDDMKMLENLPDANKKANNKDDFRLAEKLDYEEKKDEKSAMQKAAEVAKMLEEQKKKDKEQEKKKNEEKAMREALGDDIYFKGNFKA